MPRSWSPFILMMVLPALGCVSQGEHERQVAELTARAEAADGRAVAAERREKEAGSRASEAAHELRSCQEKVAAMLRPPKPFVIKLAALLDPGAKLPKEMKTEGDERMWDIEDVEGVSLVTLARGKTDKTAWHIGLNGKLTPDDFGPVQKVKQCEGTLKSEVYKVVGGPLAGAYFWDQKQDQFILGNEAYVRGKSLGCLAAKDLP